MYIENEVYAYCSSVFLFFARMKKMKAALRLTIRTPPTANSHVPFSPVCGRSKPSVLITLIGTIAETETVILDHTNCVTVDGCCCCNAGLAAHVADHTALSRCNHNCDRILEQRVAVVCCDLGDDILIIFKTLNSECAGGNRNKGRCICFLIRLILDVVDALRLIQLCGYPVLIGIVVELELDILKSPLPSENCLRRSRP